MEDPDLRAGLTRSERVHGERLPEAAGWPQAARVHAISSLAHSHQGMQQHHLLSGEETRPGEQTQDQSSVRGLGEGHT